MLPVLALVAAASAWEGFATGVGVGLAVYKASKIKLQCYISIFRKKVGDCMYPFVGFAVALVACALLED